jgi:hypothetical protein
VSYDDDLTETQRVNGALATNAETRDYFNSILEPFTAVVRDPRPGETVADYSRAAANQARRVLPPASPLAKLDFREVPQSALGNLVGELKNAVSAAVYDGSTLPPGQFRTVNIRDVHGGVRETIFVGSRPFTDQFKQPSRLVRAINAPAVTNLLQQMGFRTSGR